jgi:hypothetical protein
MFSPRSANELARKLEDALIESLALDQLSLAEVMEGDPSEFLLINPPSVVSSMGWTTLSSSDWFAQSSVPRTGSMVNSPQSTIGGAGGGGLQGWQHPQGEFSHMTPQCWGGSLFSVQQGGVGARPSSQHTSLVSSPGSLTSSRAFMGAAKPTNFSVVHIDNTVHNLCLARIGQSNCFLHCHIVSNPVTQTTWSQVSPAAKSLLHAGGQSFRSNRDLHPHQCSAKQILGCFERRSMACCQWSHLFVDAMHDVLFEEFEEFQQGMEEECIVAEEEYEYNCQGAHKAALDSVVEGGTFSGVTFADDLDGLGDGMEWSALVPPMREQLNALNLLQAATSKRMDEYGEALLAIDSVLTQTVRMHLQELGDIIVEHGTLMAALDTTSHKTSIHQLTSNLQVFQQQVEEYVTAADVTKVDMIKLITNVLNHTKQSTQAAVNRITTIKQLLDVALPQSPMLRGHTFDQNTSFMTVHVGGHEQELTMFLVFSMICELKAKVEMLSDCSKNTGVIFQGCAFALESEFALWFAKENPSGVGLASFVDIVPIWGFSGADQQDTAAMLTNLVHLKQVRFASSADAPYVNSMGSRYPGVLFGAGAKSVLSTTIIKVFKTWKDWLGTGGIDGHKQKLNQAMVLAVHCHNQYCTDALVLADLLALALGTAENTNTFWRSFTAYIYKEFTLLTLFKLSDKNVLLLFLNQVVQIFDDLFELRSTASHVDPGNKVLMASQCAWVTLQAQGCMEGYLKHKFRHHPAISGTFVRFLTQYMATQAVDGDAVAVPLRKVNALTSEVKGKVSMLLHN